MDDRRALLLLAIRRGLLPPKRLWEHDDTAAAAAPLKPRQHVGLLAACGATNAVLDRWMDSMLPRPVPAAPIITTTTSHPPPKANNHMKRKVSSEPPQPQDGTPTTTGSSLARAAGSSGNEGLQAQPTSTIPPSLLPPPPPPPPTRTVKKSKIANDTSNPPQHPSSIRNNNTTTNTKTQRESIELYCVCKSPWGEDELRPMIGCDSCDGWYHPSCLGFQGMDKRGTTVTLVDADGVKLDASNKFVCPNCELTSKTALPERIRLTAARLMALCDAMDCVDLGMNDDSTETAVPLPLPAALLDGGVLGTTISVGSNRRLLRVRWRVLVEARRQVKEISRPCSECGLPHHPLLPCKHLVKQERETRLDTCLEAKTVNPPPEAIVAVLDGKYQGRVAWLLPPQTSDTPHAAKLPEGWSCLRDESSTTFVVLEKQHVLLNPEGSDDLPVIKEQDGGDEDDISGVVSSPGGLFEARISFDNQGYISLGKFSSRFRAARVHDVACRLQFGEGYPYLNYSVTHVITPPSTATQSIKDALNWCTQVHVNGGGTPRHVRRLGLLKNVLGEFAQVNEEEITIKKPTNTHADVTIITTTLSKSQAIATIDEAMADD